MSNLVPVYNTDRMVHEYFYDCYQPAIERYTALKADDSNKARELALWKKKVIDNWDTISIQKVTSNGTDTYDVGENLEVTAFIQLGKLEPGDVTVELYAGYVDASGMLVDANPLPMKWKEKKQNSHVFEGTIQFRRSGKIGYSLRILPAHPEPSLYNNHTLIKWAD